MDWMGFLQRKYDIMQQNADTNRMGMVSSVNLDNVRARLLPDQTAADIGRVRAETSQIGAQTSQIGPLARAQIGLYGAQARNYNSTAASADEDTAYTKRYNARGAFGLLDNGPSPYGNYGMRFRFSE